MNRSIVLQTGLAYDGFIASQVYADADERKLMHHARRSWNSDAEWGLDSLAGMTLRASMQSFSDSFEARYSNDDAVAFFSVHHASVIAEVHAARPDRARAILDEIRAAMPVSDGTNTGSVPVHFWTYSTHGPRMIRRNLDAPLWETINGNYVEETAENLGPLMDPDFRPGAGGQLILWMGEPGTGKTTALRALAQSWRGWADVHYIVDPDKFFGAHADYMLDVMLTDDGGEPPAHKGQHGEAPAEPRWRVLILEDSGELLQRDSRQETGQGLSRFLNAVDGLIGQGLRVMVLVTTNEPIGKLHPAVARPGRCAAKIDFLEFDSATAERWMVDQGAVTTPRITRSLTLADLYALLGGYYDQATPRETVGFGAR